MSKQSGKLSLTQEDVRKIAGLLQSGKLQEVERLCSLLIGDHPKAVVLYDLKSKAQIGSGNFEGVADTLKAAIEIEPRYIEGEYNLGMAYMNLNRLEDAKTCFESVIKKQPAAAEAYLNLGAIHAETNEFEKAVELYRKAIEVKPDFVPALRNLGTALRDLGRLEQPLEIWVDWKSQKKYFCNCRHFNRVLLQVTSPWGQPALR